MFLVARYEWIVSGMHAASFDVGSRRAGGYSPSDGLPKASPDLDAKPLTGTSARQLLYPIRRRVVAMCNRVACCKTLARAAEYGCTCRWCRDGSNTFLAVAGKKNRGCQCHFWGSCPRWFNKNCSLKKPPT
jgi:hypothetical protein